MKATRFTQAVAVCVLLGGCTAREPEPEELFPPEPPGRFEEFSPTEGPRALLVNEPSVLAELTFEKVLEQLATSAGAEVDAIGVYQRWWDGLNPASEAATSEAVHCDETTPPETLNGFPITCPKLEGELANILPIEGYSPVAAVNRFDLAPPDGANCGEARVVFSLESALLFVHMVIFEALLPNPEPELGLAGCRPWVNVWLGLEDASTPDAAQRLAALYLTGIDGLPPVIRAQGLGLGHEEGPTGRIRTNTLSAHWQLREFVLDRRCAEEICQLDVVPTPLTDVAFSGLFTASKDPRAQAAADALVSQVKKLATSTPAELSLSFPRETWAPENNPDAPRPEAYGRFASGHVELRERVQAELDAIASPLAPEDIYARATATTCSGCHELSSGVNIGQGESFPRSLGFLHVDQGMLLSPALVEVFLPQRRAFLDAFLASQP